jgi:hypothetical protein
MWCSYLIIDGNRVTDAEDSVLAFAVDVGGGAIFGIFVDVFVDAGHIAAVTFVASVDEIK